MLLLVATDSSASALEYTTNRQLHAYTPFNSWWSCLQQAKFTVLQRWPVHLPQTFLPCRNYKYNLFCKDLVVKGGCTVLLFNISSLFAKKKDDTDMTALTKTSAMVVTRCHKHTFAVVEFITPRIIGGLVRTQDIM